MLHHVAHVASDPPVGRRSRTASRSGQQRMKAPRDGVRPEIFGEGHVCWLVNGLLYNGLLMDCYIM